MSKQLETIGALDCSTTGTDYLVFLVGAVFADHVEIVAMYRRQKPQLESTLTTVAAMAKEYEIDRIVVETTGGVGELYREEIERRDDIEAVAIGFNTTATSKPLAIERLQLFLERGWVVIPPAAKIIADELAAFQREGRKLEASKGNNDDTVMALAFLVSLVEIDALEDSSDTTNLASFAPPSGMASQTKSETRGMFSGGNRGGRMGDRGNRGSTRWRNR